MSTHPIYSSTTKRGLSKIFCPIWGQIHNTWPRVGIDSERAMLLNKVENIGSLRSCVMRTEFNRETRKYISMAKLKVHTFHQRSDAFRFRILLVRSSTPFASRWYNLWIPIRKDPEPRNDIDEDYFVGNVVIVLFVSFLTLLLHLLLVSAVEAYWLQAKEVN